jgi:hypothetical protein
MAMIIPVAIAFAVILAARKKLNRKLLPADDDSPRSVEPYLEAVRLYVFHIKVTRGSRSRLPFV